jgi:hypothetical protein
MFVSACFLSLGAIAIDPAFACSMSSIMQARADSVTISNYYWIASASLGVIVICIELFRKWISVIMVLAAALVVFHPAWLLQPNYYPDCSFQNVEGSQADLMLLGVLLGYQIVRHLRRAR